MKKQILLLLISFIFCSDSLAGQDTSIGLLEKWGCFRSYGSKDGGNPGLTGIGAFAGGATSNMILKRSGLNNNKLFSLLRILISTFGPGLLAADYLDDKKLNGSIFRDCVGLFKADKDSATRLFDILLTKAGVANVAYSGLGVLLTDYFDPNK